MSCVSGRSALISLIGYLVTQLTDKMYNQLEKIVRLKCMYHGLFLFILIRHLFPVKIQNWSTAAAYTWGRILTEYSSFQLNALQIIELTAVIVCACNLL